MIWRKASEMPELFEKAVSGQSIGYVSEPLESGAGFHLLKLLMLMTLLMLMLMLMTLLMLTVFGEISTMWRSVRGQRGETQVMN